MSNLSNSFSDDELRGMITGNNPVSNAYRELLAYREAQGKPVMWWTGPEPTWTGEIESTHDHETGSHPIPLFAAPQPLAVPPELTKAKLHEIWDEKLDKGERFNDSFREGYEYCRAILLAAASKQKSEI